MAKVTLHATIFGEDGIKTRDYETALIPDAKNQEMQVINLYPDKTYQKIEGFGAALTESAGYALSRMSKENQKKVVDAYYGKDGIGYTIGRVHMDSCDFSVGNYCAVENPDDPEFKDFNLERDAKYVQPLVKAVSKTLGKPVSLLLSPWSPPAFMKETGVRNGHLKKECYQDYANYIAKYITEYEKLGMPISWMTVQNEPLAVQTWDSCEYTAAEEKEFLRDYLYPTLKEKGLEHVKLYIWDHNKERTYERTRDIVDETTKDMIAGVAYHWYSGDHFDTLSMVKEDYPDHKVIVPGKSLQEISKILSGETEDEVRIFFTGNHIVFEFDATTVVSRLIEGEYFKINQMLSSDYETKFIINKKELLSCIDRATLLVKEGDKKPIILRISDDNMEINIQSQLGSMQEDIDIEKTGKDIMIGFNPKFLIDALRVIDDENVTIYMVNPKAPCYIKDDGQKYVYLILTVNFNTAVN